MTVDTKLSVRSPADLVAAVPYLLGFHPVDSLTVVAMRGSRVVFAARHDLPRPDAAEQESRAEALHVATVVARQDVDAATVIGHGPAARVTPAVSRLADALHELRVPVVDVLRVTDGRYWSYLCADPACCPPEGLPCDAASSVVAAEATYAGQVALPDRQSLADVLAPVTGAARDAMAAATGRAQQRRNRLCDSAAGPADPAEGCRLAPGDAAVPVGVGGGVDGGVDGGAAEAVRRAVLRAGRAAVRAAFRRYRDGGHLTDDEAAWLGVLLTDLPVRDYAWERADGSDWQLALWTDVVRRMEPDFVPAPASLLGFAAWRSGQGALASVAVERARRQDPGYHMAVLLDDVLRYALPPSAVHDWPVPGDRPARAPRAHGRRGARRSGNNRT